MVEACAVVQPVWDNFVSQNGDTLLIAIQAATAGNRSDAEMVQQVPVPGGPGLFPWVQPVEPPMTSSGRIS